MTDTPQTVAGALRAYTVLNMPDIQAYRNSAPADIILPVAIFIDPIDTITRDLGDQLALVETVQVDLYLDRADASSTPDALHALLHKAPISIPGSHIHRVAVVDRRLDVQGIDDDGVHRIIYTVQVTRRIVSGDASQPLPLPVRPDRLTAHETKTTNVHGIANTANLETQAGAQAKADAAITTANAYTDAAVANIDLPDNVETTEGAQAKADAALTAANTYSDEAIEAAVGGIDFSSYETITGAQEKADSAAAGVVVEAKSYTDAAVAPLASTATVDAKDAATLTAANEHANSVSHIAYVDALTFANNAANGVWEAANAHSDAAIEALSETVATDYVANTVIGQAGGVASLDGNGRVPNSQLPPLSISETHAVANETEMLSLVAERGDIAIRSDLSRSFILAEEPSNVVSNWLELSTPPDAVLSVEGRVGVVSLSDLYDAAGAASAAQGAAESHSDASLNDHINTPDAHGDRADAATKYVPLTDARLTDQRTPLDGSVTSSKIVAGAITGTKLALGAVSDSTVASNAGINPSKLGAAGASAGQALVWTGTAWAPGTVTPSRATASLTTATLVAGETANLNITLAKGYRLLSIAASATARVRIYTTAAARTADSSRAEGSDPAWNAGVVADFVLGSADFSGALSPAVDGVNLEATPSSAIPIAVTNRSTSSAAITVTLVYLPQEN